MLTVWVEHEVTGRKGAKFDLTIVERCLVGGRVIWFYLGKLFWPAHLIFIYPRWQISQAVWWQYLYPAAALVLLTAFWGLRRRWRGPLAGLLFFAGMLFPVLGFFNVYYFSYSFVADHFQYLASLGIITLVSAGAAHRAGAATQRAASMDTNPKRKRGRRTGPSLALRVGVRSGRIRVVPGVVGRLGRLDLPAMPDVRRQRDALSNDDRQ